MKNFSKLFDKLVRLMAKIDIYAEKDIPFQAFTEKNPSAVGKNFDFRQFMLASKLEFWRDVRTIADSDVPNCFFVMAWDEFFHSKQRFYLWLQNNASTPFAMEYYQNEKEFSFVRDKIYWELFAIILACRGAERVQDVAPALLSIFTDVNRLGIFPVQCLVCNNAPKFKNAIRICLQKAKDEEEEYWTEYLSELSALS